MMVVLGQMRHKRSIRWWLMRPVSSWGGSDLIHAVEEVPSDDSSGNANGDA